ncbi:hypothetical protein FH972_008486 [Carpinus fangiana]|uniref:Uncharacterized protein n=1 Tax=Carpinus fangiana TaxID=176857 RepID=A0A5N6R1N3_9ROSI|nr:hypothetical protein FH972_008486 [Carpinus fangiana]
MGIKLNYFAFESLPSVALLPTRAQRSPKGKAMSLLGHASVNVVCSMLPENIEIFKSIEEWVRSDILTLLKPVKKSWQPYDFLPNPISYGFIEQVNELRERTKDIPDDYFVVLVGNMITEEALPTYQALINSI